MSTRNIVLISIIAFILLLGGCGCSGYNSLVDKDVKVKTAWANVESEYQRRSDLIPNLVSTVKGSANFEQETLTGVINARSKATGITIDANNLTPEKVAEFQKAQNAQGEKWSNFAFKVPLLPAQLSSSHVKY